MVFSTMVFSPAFWMPKKLPSRKSLPDFFGSKLGNTFERILHHKAALKTCVSLWQAKIALEHGPLEDVFPMNNGDVPANYFSLTE